LPEFLCRLRATRTEMLVRSTPEEDRLVAEHFEYLRDLAERGIVLLAGRTLNTDASSFGIVVYAANSDSHAQSLVDADPAIRAGLFEAELFPYRLALVSESLLESAEPARRERNTTSDDPRPVERTS
jgi:uncharacterized protein YciI